MNKVVLFKEYMNLVYSICLVFLNSILNYFLKETENGWILILLASGIVNFLIVLKLITFEKVSQEWRIVLLVIVLTIQNLLLSFGFHGEGFQSGFFILSVFVQNTGVALLFFVVFTFIQKDIILITKFLNILLFVILSVFCFILSLPIYAYI